MPKTRQEKAELVSALKDKFARAKAVVFARVSGYTMNEANELRSKAKAEGLDVMITKKTLLERAAKDAGIELNRDLLEGSILTAFGYDDEIAPARVVAKFAKDHASVEVSSGVLEGAVVGMETVKAFAALPSRDELLARMVGSINAPVSGFVNVLAGNLRGLVQVLNSIKEQKA